MNGKKDIVSGSIFVVLDAIYLILCGTIEPFTGKGTPPMTNQFIPYFWGGFMMLLSIMLVVRGVKQQKKAGKVPGKEPAKMGARVAHHISENREVILSFTALFLYIGLLEKIGFVIMTVLFLSAEILILTPKEKRNYLLAVVTGIVGSGVLYFVFGKTLHILLPAGIFSF